MFPTQRGHIKFNWYEEAHNLHCGFACGDDDPHNLSQLIYLEYYCYFLSLEKL